MASDRDIIQPMRCRPVGRRQFLRAALLVGSAGVLGACAPAPAAPQVVKETQVVEQTVTVKETVVVKEPAQAAGTTVIRFSVWGDVPDCAVYDQIADRFNEAHADIKAIPEQYLDAYYEKIQTNFAGGNSADLLYFQGWSWQPYADKGNLLIPLDDYIKKDNWIAPWPDLQVHNNYSKWHGQTFMQPADSGAVVMFYNKALFEKRGVPYPKDGWTYEDFQSAVEKLSFDEGGVRYYGYAQAGGWNGQMTRSLVWMRKDGQIEFDQIVEPKEARFNQPEIAAALQYTICDVIEKNFCPSPSVIAGGGVTIATGRVAMTMEGPWFLAQMYGKDAAVEGGVPFDVVMPPVGKAGFCDTELSTSGHVITKQCKNPDAAWLLLKFIGSDDGQQLVANGGRQPGTPDMMTKHWVPIVGKTYNFTRPEVFVQAMSEKRAHGVIVGGAQCNFDAFSTPEGGLGVAWDAMLGLQKTAQEAMDELNPKIQKMIDDYWKKKQG